MAPSSITAYTALRPAPRPDPLCGHIGDLPHEVIHRILFWKLLANGELPAVVAFVVATPFFAQKAGHAGRTDYLVACGLDWTSVLWQQDVNFWQKCYKLRRAQGAKRG